MTGDADPNDWTYCAHCGEEITDLSQAVPNTDPWGRIHGYFCNDDCLCNAGEAWDERQAEAFYGGSEPFTAKEIQAELQKQRDDWRNR